MSYQVIARKWRPQSFLELVGQDHISTTLLNALKNNRLPQALLFTGPRGTGKTSTARILAKSLRCASAKDFVPCGVCDICEDIANSRSLDVIEIDGASNNGVDAVRELRETVGYMPSSGRYKVYIIDEVHMLSTSAFNALLKTLEEPPPHVVFIMATTEAQKIPNTILSHCQRFDFRRIPSRQIAGHLEKICVQENVSYETEALWQLARQADGSMRDSQSLLDQVITFCEGQVTLARVIQALGLTDRTLLVETLQSLIQRDMQAVLPILEKINVAAYDPKLFAQDLLEEIRHALMVRVCVENPERIVDLPDAEIDALRQMTKSLGEEDLHLLFDMTLKGVSDLLRSQDSKIVLEVLLMRMAAAPRVAQLQQLLSGQAPQGSSHISNATQAMPQKLSTQATSKPIVKTAAEMSTDPRTAPATRATSPQPKVNQVAGQHTSNNNSYVTQAKNSAQATKQQEPARDGGADTDAAKSKDPWFNFVHRVQKANGLLGALLEHTNLLGETDQRLLIGVPKKMSFLFDKLKDPENLKRIETFVETLWNKKLSVEVKLTDEKAVVDATPKEMAENENERRKRLLEEQVENDPLVRSAKAAFKTTVKSIKEKT